MNVLKTVLDTRPDITGPKKKELMIQMTAEVTRIPSLKDAGLMPKNNKQLTI